jgi:hypothetical protein
MPSMEIFWVGWRSGGVSCLVSKYEMKHCTLTTLHKLGKIFPKFKIFSSSLRYVTKPYQFCKWHGTMKCYMALYTVFTIHSHPINHAVDSAYLNQAIINHLANFHTQTQHTVIRCLCYSVRSGVLAPSCAPWGQDFYYCENHRCYGTICGLLFEDDLSSVFFVYNQFNPVYLTKLYELPWLYGVEWKGVILNNGLQLVLGSSSRDLF